MAFATIIMTNGIELKKAPIGFSWTTFFFGGWPAIFRQDWLWGIALILACVFTWGIAGIVCAFIYNKSYLKRLYDKGYTISGLPPGVTEDTVKHYLGFVTLPGSSK